MQEAKLLTFVKSLATLLETNPRQTFDPITGVEKRFISGYVNSVTPNLWNTA